MEERRWDRLDGAAGLLFVVLIHAGGLLSETATSGRTEPGSGFAAAILARPRAYALSQYLVGLGTLCFLWFCWGLRGRLRRAEGEPGRLADLAFAAGAGWGLLWVLASLLGANALLLADFFQHPDGARLVAALELPTTPLGLFLQGVFAGATSLVALRHGVLPRWLGWAGAVPGAGIVLGATALPLADPVGLRPSEEIGNPLTFLSGLLAYGLFQLWVVATSVVLMRGPPRAAEHVVAIPSAAAGESGQV